jgi:hypothetical protein
VRRWLAVAVGLAAALVLVAAGYLGIVPGVKGRYRNSDPSIATAYRAKDACSCLFVLGRDEAFCRAWTRASPEVADLAVDREARVVTSRALGFWSARARWTGERSGCVLDDGGAGGRAASGGAAAREARER